MSEYTDQAGLILPKSETPSEETLRVLGDFLFLAQRSPHHRRMPAGMFADAVTPPITSDQFKLFRFDGIPRGLFTWARLSSDAERRYVSGGILHQEDWRSGDRLWIIDLIAPYKGLTTSIVRWITVPGNLTTRDFRFRRVRDGKVTRRIVHIDFNRPGALSKIETDEDFL